ncbi:MAG: multicopper oxidase domain-containing protein [Leptolyngbyaceae cyanobacterium RU_5_1]|nr:multicopper oxidase domain-containing protein [Leptolyngbyaceae cyanobacterium RU_5_1]
MPYPQEIGEKLWNRRKLLQLGLGGVATAGIAGGYQWFRQRSSGQPVRVPLVPTDTPAYGNGINPLKMVRDFDYGKVKQENGRTIREFQIIASTTTLQLNSAVSYITWNYNGRVPGPTLRAREGDRVRVSFLNQGGHAHTMHFHGIHPTAVDGVRPVSNGKAFIYEFDAVPYGVHLYHCHIAPVTRHISKGLHGMFIVDPKEGRSPADEIVLVMDAYDTNDDNRNELYAFNGLPNYYKRYPIPIYQNQLVRLYLLNVVEFDAALTFHTHANFFRVYPTGMTLKPSYETDVITMGTAERHILEFAYPYPGKYMFHPHQDAIAEAGCMGLFDVIPQNS